MKQLYAKKIANKFFNYMYISILPNIYIYNLNNSTTISFTEDQVKEYIWGTKLNNKYHVLLKLKNSTYIYLYGTIEFNKDKFKIFISKDMDEVLNYMHKAVYCKYRFDTIYT